MIKEVKSYESPREDPVKWVRKPATNIEAVLAVTLVFISVYLLGAFVGRLDEVLLAIAPITPFAILLWLALVSITILNS